MMRWLPIAATGGIGALAGIVGMPWAAQVALSSMDLATYFGQHYLQYRLASKALDKADRRGVPEIMLALTGQPHRRRQRRRR